MDLLHLWSKVITFMVSITWSIFITFMVGITFMVFITFMGDTCPGNGLKYINKSWFRFQSNYFTVSLIE